MRWPLVWRSQAAHEIGIYKQREQNVRESWAIEAKLAQDYRNEIEGWRKSSDQKDRENGALQARLRECEAGRVDSRELVFKLDAALVEAHQRYDALVDKMLAMKLQGYAVLPKKIGPLVPEPEDRHMKKQGPDVVDPWIESIVAEGFTREEALAARKQVVADFNSGEG